MDQIILNGRLVAKNQPLFFASNRSFRYGDGLFETMRYHRGKVWWLTDHLERLLRGMEFLGLVTTPPFTAERIYQDLQLLQPPPNARLRLTIFRSGAGAYRPQSDAHEYLLEASELPGDTYQTSNEGLHCCWFTGLPVGSPPFSQHKTANALPYVLAARHAQAQGYDDAFLLNNDDNLAEASSSNVFLWQAKKLVTPPLSEGCLDGVLRKQMLRISLELGFPVIERPIAPTDLPAASSIWLTNTIKGIEWVRKMEDKEYVPGPLRTFAESLNKATYSS
jgi:branched-chain amino acid aminotransferase